MRGFIPGGTECRIKTETTETYCMCLVIDPRINTECCKLYNAIIRNYEKADECKKERPQVVVTAGEVIATEPNTREQESVQPKKRGRKPNKFKIF